MTKLATLYKYLRHRGVEIGTAEKSKRPQTLRVGVHLRVENNSRFVRGKGQSRRDIEEQVFTEYQMQKPDSKGWEYQLTIPYNNEDELENTIDEILAEAASIADLRNGFIEADVCAMDGTVRTW